MVSALRKGGCALMKKTLDQPGCHVMASNKAGHTLLHCACRLGDEEAVQLLLERGADQASCDECGKTPLHDACARGHLGAHHRLRRPRHHGSR